MTPTILSADGQLFMVTGSPGGRTIINTALETIVDVVDFRHERAGGASTRVPHISRLPDRIDFERLRILHRTR